MSSSTTTLNHRLQLLVPCFFFCCKRGVRNGNEHETFHKGQSFITSSAHENKHLILLSKAGGGTDREEEATMRKTQKLEQ
jgi:hypothetical protein